MIHKLTDTEFQMVCKVIASNVGLHFPIERRDILSRNLANVSRDLGFHKMKEFIQWFLLNQMTNDQIGVLASHLTISETYFWREPQVFNAFTQSVLTELLESKKRKDNTINIWCAGCSTGEEAYSIAIALYRTIRGIEKWNINIIASDLNPTALSKALTGLYSSWSFRNSPGWIKDFYFKKHNNREFEILPEIKKMVNFKSFNLTQGNYLSSICRNTKMDLIFCRNVLMYLTREWSAKISQNLYDSISENGWLIVSSCELSGELFPQFEAVNFPGAVLYRKSKMEFNRDDIHSSLSDNQNLYNEVQSLTPYVNVFNQLNNGEAKRDSINEEGFRNPEFFDNTESEYHDPSKSQTIPEVPEETINRKKTSIRVLADKGNLEEALSVCNEAIATEKLVPSLYFLRATILQELNKSSEAIKSLKQAIYIDPGYVMGHFTLGNIFIRQGIIHKAKQYFNNALELLSKISNDEFPLESEGLSARYLREIIMTILQTHKPT